MELPRHRPSVRPAPAPDPARPALDIAELTRRLAAGDDMAYRAFHEAYCSRLSRYLLVVAAGSEEAMREALQETYRRVVKHVRVFSDEAVFWSWLTVLARSALADEGRKRRRYLAFLDRFTRHATATPARDDGDPLGEALARHVALLPTDERTLLEAKYFERESVSSIATRLQTSEKSVESRLSRIRQKLRAAVLAELKHEPPA